MSLPLTLLPLLFLYYIVSTETLIYLRNNLILPKDKMGGEVRKMDKEVKIANMVVERFEAIHGEGESRGACHVIADQIANEIDGSVVCRGYVCMNQGDMQHWWVEKDGIIIDPLAERWMDKPYRHIKYEDREMAER